MGDSPEPPATPATVSNTVAPGDPSQDRVAARRAALTNLVLATQTLIGAANDSYSDVHIGNIIEVVDMRLREMKRAYNYQREAPR